MQFSVKIFAFVLLTLGFAKLTTVFLNLSLAKPRTKLSVAFLEIAELLLVSTYVLTVVQLLFSPQFFPFRILAVLDSFQFVESAFVALGLFGFVLLVRAAISYHQYRPPHCQSSLESVRIDFREHPSWKETLIGSRALRGIALLPGNEQFTVEVSTKTYTLPRIPPEWDGLSIVHFADLHFYGPVTRKYFELVCERAIALQPDMYVFTGDLLDHPSMLNWLPETLGRLKAPLGQYFVLGNHDWYVGADEIRAEFVRHNWIDLASRSIRVDPASKSVPILLAGDETPWMGKHPAVDSADQHLFRILLSHTPDNINWARNAGFDVVLAGHTHGGQIRPPFLGPILSPSYHGCRFASGVFWLDPTLLYVSRGLSGREPIRFNCPPELTKIVLTRGNNPISTSSSTLNVS